MAAQHEVQPAEPFLDLTQGQTDDLAVIDVEECRLAVSQHDGRIRDHAELKRVQLELWRQLDSIAVGNLLDVAEA